MWTATTAQSASKFGREEALCGSSVRLVLPLASVSLVLASIRDSFGISKYSKMYSAFPLGSSTPINVEPVCTFTRQIKGMSMSLTKSINGLNFFTTDSLLSWLIDS